MNQKIIDELSRNVVEARAEAMVLQGLCAMLVVELALLKAPDEAAGEAEAMVDRFSALTDAYASQPGSIGQIVAPIAREIVDRVRTIAGTTLQGMSGPGEQ